MPLNLIGTIVSSILNAEQASETRAQNRENMFIQSELNRSQYDYERSAESPSSMVKAFESAGLNPALMYGGAGHSLTSGTSLQGTQAVSTAPSNPYRISAPTSMELAQFRNISEDTKSKEIDNQTRATKNILELETQKANILNLLSASGKNSAEAQKYIKQLEQIDAAIENLKAQTKTEGARKTNLEAQTGTEGARKTNLEAQTETEGSKRVMYESQAELNSEQSESESNKRALMAEQTKYYQSLTKKEDEMSNYLKSATAHKNALTESEKQHLKKLVAETADIYVRLGIDGAKAVSDIISTWVPSPAKLINEVTEIFKKDTKTGTKTTIKKQKVSN